MTEELNAIQMLWKVKRSEVDGHTQEERSRSDRRGQRPGPKVTEARTHEMYTAGCNCDLGCCGWTLSGLTVGRMVEVVALDSARLISPEMRDFSSDMFATGIFGISDISDIAAEHEHDRCG